MEPAPVFPVLALSQDSSILAFPDGAALRRCTTTPLVHGYYDGLEIFDAAERRFTVVSVASPRLTGLARWLDRLVGGRVEVVLELSPPERCELDALKERVCAQLDREPEFWAAGSGSLDEAKATVREAESFSVLLELF